jgi:hypothetical protein
LLEETKPVIWGDEIRVLPPNSLLKSVGCLHPVPPNRFRQMFLLKTDTNNILMLFCFRVR